MVPASRVSGRAAPFWRRLFRLMFQPLGAIVSKQSLQIVAIGPETAEGVLIEQAFDAAAGADLVGASLRTDGPTHFAVPAAAEQNGGARHTGREQSHGP